MLGKRGSTRAKSREFRTGGRPQPGYSLTKADKRISDEQIKEWLLEAVAGEGKAYGYRKLTIYLEREHDLVINKKVSVKQPPT